MTLTEFATSYHKEIIAALGTTGVTIIHSLFQPRARLLQSVRHTSTILINEPTFDKSGTQLAPTKLVRVEQVSFFNDGSRPATDLQVTFNWRPQHLNIWPQRHYAEKLAPDGRFTLDLGVLPPKELIVIDLLSVASELPAVTFAHCCECAAEIIKMTPQEVHPRWKLRLVLFLIIAGLAAVIYAGVTVVTSLLAVSAP